jgi:hypothetical protein
VQHQIATAEIHRAEEQVWWRRIGLALAGTIGIAFLAVLYAGRLEDRLRRERDKDAQHTRDLQRLSARLVAAQEEERRSIARELHDEVGQVLTAIKVDLQMAQRSLQAQGHDTAALTDLQDMTDGALGTVRDLSHLLRPTMLDDLGLGAAIDWQLRSLARRHNVMVELVRKRVAWTTTPVTAFASSETLTNVARHQRRRCWCSLTRGQRWWPMTARLRLGAVERHAAAGGWADRTSQRVAERGTCPSSAPGRGTRVSSSCRCGTRRRRLIRRVRRRSRASLTAKVSHG